MLSFVPEFKHNLPFTPLEPDVPERLPPVRIVLFLREEFLFLFSVLSSTLIFRDPISCDVIGFAPMKREPVA